MSNQDPMHYEKYRWDTLINGLILLVGGDLGNKVGLEWTETCDEDEWKSPVLDLREVVALLHIKQQLFTCSICFQLRV